MLPPSLQNRHNFAIFCFFGGTRKIVYAKVHWNFQNPPRKPQSHQNSDFLGLGTPRDTVYPWGEGANEQKTNKRIKISLFGQKQDLRRVRALVRTCQETSRGPHKILCTCGAKWHQNSDFLGILGTPQDTCTCGA